MSSLGVDCYSVVGRTVCLVWNNAVMGARFTYNYKNIVRLKAIWGTPRFGMDFSDTQVRGVDVSSPHLKCLVGKIRPWSIEGGALNRYEKINIDLEEEGENLIRMASRTGKF